MRNLPIPPQAMRNLPTLRQATTLRPSPTRAMPHLPILALATTLLPRQHMVRTEPRLCPTNLPCARRLLYTAASVWRMHVYCRCLIPDAAAWLIWSMCAMFWQAPLKLPMARPSCA